MPLFAADGSILSSGNSGKTYAKSASPITGEAFAPRWAGDTDKYIFNLPGGGTVIFDLSKLRLADFRTMRDHYQVNATLSVLTFMLHQMDWKIECDKKSIADQITLNIEEIWTPLIRALSQAFWSGYSPSVLQWENGSKYIELTKVKDLIPEECFVNWQEVPGWAPPGNIKPKIRVFDGIKVWGQNWPVPADNSLWYPLLMENGDYYGKKLLRPVFTSWYFSILMHLFSNRYFERFGEPVPVGRASYEEEITVPGTGGSKKVLGADLMVQILQNLRNRSVVVLPNDRTQIGTHGGANSTEYDYNIEYLESQMRGADFERYLMRLDEEISLGLFTPLLILRTADVGSYNLGTTHWSMYLNMLHAIASDIKYYIDNFILSRLVDFNWGKNAPRAKIKFRKMADDRKDLVLQMMQALIASGAAKPDLNQIGDIAGLDLTEVQQLTVPPGTNPADPNAQPTKKPADNKTKAGGTKPNGTAKKVSKNTQDVISNISARISGQSRSNLDFGYNRQLGIAFDIDGAEDGHGLVDELYRFSEAWIEDLPSSFNLNSGIIERVMTAKAEELLNA